MGLDIRKQIDWELGLKAGDAVEARWTNCGSAYRAAAEVVRVNRSSVRVLVREGYLAGRTISVPLFRSMSSRWSASNGVFAAPAALAVAS